MLLNTHWCLGYQWSRITNVAPSYSIHIRVRIEDCERRETQHTVLICLCTLDRQVSRREWRHLRAGSERVVPDRQVSPIGGVCRDLSCVLSVNKHNPQEKDGQKITQGHWSKSFHEGGRMNLFCSSTHSIPYKQAATVVKTPDSIIYYWNLWEWMIMG